METAYLETELLQGLSGGSIAAFDRLYYRYHEAVYANICKMVREPAAAEDILQEVFLALWAKRADIHQDRSVAGWLFVVSYNKAATYLKRKLKGNVILMDSPGGLENIALDEPEQGEPELHRQRLSMIEDAVGRLSSRKREVFRLVRFEGRSHEEVADAMGISVETVRDYLKQSTRFIKDHIAGSPSARGMAGLALFLWFIGH